MPAPAFTSEAEFQRYAKLKATEFNLRYGATRGWTDQKLDQALRENGMPPLAKLPDTPQGMMLEQAVDTAPSRAWRRVNAAHLLGHVMLHDGERCNGCREWA